MISNRYRLLKKSVAGIPIDYLRCKPVCLCAIYGLLLGVLIPTVFAHPDLELQIEELTRQLSHQPDTVEWLLKRGDLQRRHENWAPAYSDFKRVRKIQPGNGLIDWFEGRLAVEAGEAKQGLDLLSRYLRSNPNQVIALQSRAKAYLLLNQPLLAAEDFYTVIRVSERPAPSLFGAQALAFVVAGQAHFKQALEVVQSGLQRFPDEMMLAGIGTDISLATADVSNAQNLLDRLPASILKLVQWQARKALLDCQTGDQLRAVQWFTHSSEGNQSTYAPAPLNAEWLSRLSTAPTPANCQAAALAMLEKQL